MMGGGTGGVGRGASASASARDRALGLGCRGWVGIVIGVIGVMGVMGVMGVIGVIGVMGVIEVGGRRRRGDLHIRTCSCSCCKATLALGFVHREPVPSFLLDLQVLPEQALAKR